VARYANVQEATVRLWSDEKSIGVQIEDSGDGFDPDTVLASNSSSGLAGMQERVFLLGGELTIESSPGQGTCLSAEIPR
jgi:signal transduction histidine kinase